MSFKDIIRRDIRAVFLNKDEFAEEHTVNGRPMLIQLDENELLERDKSRVGTHQDGLYKSRRLIYAAASDFGPRPAIGALLNLDGRQYKVADCKDEGGLLSIELEAVRV